MFSYHGIKKILFCYMSAFFLYFYEVKVSHACMLGPVVYGDRITLSIGGKSFSDIIILIKLAFY